MPPIHDAPSSSPVVINVEGVSKDFVLRKDNSLKDRLLSFRTGKQHRKAFTALNNVTLEVRAGHTIGLIGHNGSGKSTLLKIIGGILDPSEGSVSRRGRLAALLELGAGFHPDLSGRDNIYLNAALLGMRRDEIASVFDEIVAFSELGDFIDTQVKFYSSGMYVRLAFAVAVHTEPDVLLVDEVLAVGDEAFQRKCMDKILQFQNEGRTIVLVTHNLAQVRELCDSAVLLHHGELVFNGEPREAVARFRGLLEEQRQENEAMRPHPTGESPQYSATVTATPAARNPGDPIRPGDSLLISLKISGSVSNPGWIAAIQIENTSGLALYESASDQLKVELPPFGDTIELEFVLEGTCFGDGQYFVNAFLFDSHGQSLHQEQQACAFQAQAPDGTRGAISLPTSLRILSR